jgi:hypothetical protein
MGRGRRCMSVWRGCCWRWGRYCVRAARRWRISEGAVGLVGVLLTLGRNSIVYDFFYVFVPGVSVFRLQEHMSFIVSFALAVLAAYQLVWWQDADEKDTRAFRWLAVGFLTVNVAALLVALLTDATQTGTLLFVTLLAGLFVYWVFNTHRGWVAGALLVALLVVDLFTITTRTDNFVPDTPENRVPAPAELDRLQVSDVSDIQWHVDGGAGVQAHGIYWRIPDIYGIGPIFLRSMEELRQIPVHRLWEVMAVRYATMIEEPPPEATLELLAYGQNMTGDEYKVFEVQNPRPFAHLVYATIHAQGDPAFARQFMADPNVDLREFGVVLEPLNLPGERPAISEVSAFEMVTPERLEITVSTETAALLTVAIPLYPGWQATVNGEEVEIVDVYAGLVGVPLDAGAAQQVVLRFRSQAVLLGGSISAITLLLALGASVVGFLRTRTV